MARARPSVLCLIVAGTAAVLAAETRTWDNGTGSNDWHDGRNWDPNGGPDMWDHLTVSSGQPCASDDCFVDQGGSLEIRGSGTSLTSDHFVWVGYSGEGSLTVENGARIVCEGAAVRSGIRRGSRGEVTVRGQGTCVSCPLASIDVGIDGEATFTVEDGARVLSWTCLIAIGGMNRGTVVVDGAGSTWNCVLGITVADSPGSRADLTIRNGGSLSGEHGVVGSYSASSGAVTVDGTGSTLSLRRDFSIGPQSLLSVTDGGRATVGTGYSLANGGTLVGDSLIDGDVANAGHLLPGDPLGVLTIDGTCHLREQGLLEIELGGTGLGEFDGLNVTGAAALGGRLDVRLADGFVPLPGDTFGIIAAASVTGTFDEATFPDLGPDMWWEIDYGPTQATLTAVPEPASLSLLAVGALVLLRRTKR